MLQACWIVEKINATVGWGLRRKKKRFLDFSHICAFFTYLYFLWFFWFIPTVHDKFFCIENWNTVQLFTFFIFYSRGNLESGSFTYMRNSVCKYRRNSAEFRGIPVLFTAKNTAEFRGIPRNSVCFSKNSVFRRKSKTHFRGHPNRISAAAITCALLAS